VAGKRQAGARRFVRDSKEHVARRVVVHLDQIDAALLEIPDSFASFPSVRHRPAERPVRWRVVQDRPRGDDFRPAQLAAADAIAQRENKVEVRTHVARAGYSVGEIEIERLSPRRLVMRVHIPEAGNEKVARPVNSYGSRWHGDARTEARDPASPDHHRHAGLLATTDHIDNGCVGDCDRAGLIARLAGWKVTADGDKKECREDPHAPLIPDP
jgi:hypothetical protein